MTPNNQQDLLLVRVFHPNTAAAGAVRNAGTRQAHLHVMKEDDSLLNAIADLSHEHDLLQMNRKVGLKSIGGGRGTRASASPVDEDDVGSNSLSLKVFGCLDTFPCAWYPEDDPADVRAHVLILLHKVQHAASDFACMHSPLSCRRPHTRLLM